MSQETVSKWANKANSQSPKAASRQVEMTKGNIIMELSEILRPWLMSVFNGMRDENGLLVQPARVRAIALNVAQDLVNQQEQKHT